MSLLEPHYLIGYPEQKQPNDLPKDAFSESLQVSFNKVVCKSKHAE